MVLFAGLPWPSSAHPSAFHKLLRHRTLCGPKYVRQSLGNTGKFKHINGNFDRWVLKDYFAWFQQSLAVIKSLESESYYARFDLAKSTISICHKWQSNFKVFPCSPRSLEHWFVPCKEQHPVSVQSSPVKTVFKVNTRKRMQNESQYLFHSNKVGLSCPHSVRAQVP